MRRPWLLPLVPVYRVVQALVRRRGRRLRGQVVSVGSLSAGGAGKTPVVMLVVEMLREAGFAVDVLSRGYGRSGRGIERLEVGGSAARYGDEPMLLARRLGVPVWVGTDRHEAGLAAEAGGIEALVHVLDDGFQHGRLARDVDVVLLTKEDVEDTLFPAGNLRENLGALGRASVVVLREEEAVGLREVVPAGKPIWVVRRRLQFDRKIPGKVMVFCGIARPDGFLGMLTNAGVVSTTTTRFRDHHAYEQNDIALLAATASICGAKGFCTTEKDAVKLTDSMRHTLEKVGPLVVAELSLELVEGNLADLGLVGATPAPHESAQSIHSLGDDLITGHLSEWRGALASRREVGICGF